MKALVLAAGKSERLRPVLGGLPKPMAKVLDKPLLQYNLELLKKHGSLDIFINLHYQPDAVRDYFGDGSAFGVNIRYSYESEIMGTAGAVKILENNWDAPFFVVYGDNITDINLTELLARHSETRADLTMALFDPQTNPNTGMAGGRVLLNGDGVITGFVEGAGDGLVNAGVYIMNPELVSDIPKDMFCDFGRDLFPSWIRGGKKIYGYRIGGYCLGPDTPEALRRAEDILLKETAI